MPASPTSSSPGGLTSSSALKGGKGAPHGAAAARRSPPAAPSSPRRSDRGSGRQSPVSSVAAADFGAAAAVDQQQHQQKQHQEQQPQPPRDGPSAVLRSDEVQAVSDHFMRCVAERPIMMDEASLTGFAVGAGVPPETARTVVPAYVADLASKRGSTPRTSSTRSHPPVASANVARTSIELPQALELMGLCKLAFEEALQDPDEEDARNALAALRDAADQRVLAASKSRRNPLLSRPTSTDVASDSMSFSDSRADSRTAQQRLAARDNRQLAEAARELAGVDGATVSDIIEARGAMHEGRRDDVEVARAFIPRQASAEVVDAMRQLGAWFDAVSDDWVLPVASVTVHIAVPQAFLEKEGLGQEDWLGSEQFERLIACVRAQSASPPEAPLAARGSEATLGAGPSHEGSSAFDIASSRPSPVTAAGSATLGSRALRHQSYQQSAGSNNTVLSSNSRSATYGVQNSAVRMSDLLAGLSTAGSGAERLQRESDEVDRRHAARLNGNAAEPVIPRHASPYNTRPEPVPGPVTTTIAQRHALRNPRRSLGRGPSGQRTQPSSPKEAVSPTKRAPAVAGKGASPTASKPAPANYTARSRPMSGGSRLPQTARAPASVPAHSAGQYRAGAEPVPHYRASSYSDLPMLRRSRPTSAATARGKQPSQATSSDRAGSPHRGDSGEHRPVTPPKRPRGARHSPRPAVVYTEGTSTPVIDFGGRGGRSPSPNAPNSNALGAAPSPGPGSSSRGRDGQLRIVYVTDEHGNKHRHFLVPAPSAASRDGESPAPPTVGRRQQRPPSRGAATPSFDSSRDRTPTPAGLLRQPVFVDGSDHNHHARSASPSSPQMQPSSPLSPGTEAPRHADEDADELIADEVLVEEMRSRRAARFIQRKFKTWRARLKITNAYALQRIGRAFMMRRFVADIPVVIRATGERKVRTRRAIMLVMRLQAVGRGLLDRAAVGDKFSGFAENRALDDFVSSCRLSRVGRTTSAPASELFDKLLLRERKRALPSEGTRIRHEEEFAEELRAVEDDDELAHF